MCLSVKVMLELFRFTSVVVKDDPFLAQMLFKWVVQPCTAW